MTRNVKWRITAIVLLLMAVTNGMAQPFKDATDTALRKIAPAEPVKEQNTLPIAIISKLPKNKTMEFCALLRDGDYHKYYRQGISSHKERGNIIAPGVSIWVFEPGVTKPRFNQKENTATHTSQRLCQFLGLDDAIQRDTIVFLKVKCSDLFRPAYEPSIDKLMPTPADKIYTFNTKDPSLMKWFAYQQRHNMYPWTRLGYTYDWGDSKDKVGTAEFILNEGKSYDCSKQGSEIWNGTPARDCYYKTVADFFR
ncbi:hypothetical protein [Bacteroides sp.]